MHKMYLTMYFGKFDTWPSNDKQCDVNYESLEQK